MSPANIMPLPPLGIGTGSFRGLYRDVSDTEAVDTIRYALERSVTLVDTAPWYGAFEAEHIVGLALAGLPRTSYLLSTKACLWNENGEGARGYTRDKILWSLDGSLKRLRLDSVDILHIHDPVIEHYQTILDETIPTFVELRSQGIIRAIGLGTGDWRILDRLAGDFRFDCAMLAGRYTLLEQEALGTLNRLRDRGIAALSAGIYNSGILASGAVNGAKYDYGDAPAPVRQRVQRLDAACRRHGVPLKAAAAQFVRAHPAIVSIILGVESAQQVEDNLHAFDVPIPPALWDDLRAEGLILSNAPTPKAEP